MTIRCESETAEAATKERLRGWTSIVGSVRACYCGAQHVRRARHIQGDGRSLPRGASISRFDSEGHEKIKTPHEGISEGWRIPLLSRTRIQCELTMKEVRVDSVESALTAFPMSGAHDPDRG